MSQPLPAHSQRLARGSSQPLRFWIPLGLVVVLLQGCLLLLCAYLIAEHGNTLARDGRWIVSKTQLDKRVMGAFHFASEGLDGRLDLGRWHGFQEVLHSRPLAVKEISFDFALAESAYLIFVFDRTETGFRGLRLSRYRRFGDAFLTAAADGEFLTEAPFEAPALDDQWHTLRVAFESGEVDAWLDGRPLASASRTAPERQVFGFHGGLAPVEVDRVRVRSSRFRESFVESFDGTGTFRKVLVYCGAVVGLLDVALVWMAFRRGRPIVRKRLFTTLTVGLTLLAMLSLYGAAYRAVLARGYALTPESRDEDFKEQEIASVTEALRQRYSAPPAAGTTRVMLVGSSQTWGAGATREEDVFASVLERLLNAEAPPGRRFECLNAGVSALESSRLLELYASQWIDLSPDITIINLSSNDGEHGVFWHSLEGFVRLNRERGITTLFVLEANSFEHRPVVPLHATMRRVARRHGVPLIDMHRHLERSARRGLIWWDFVHPTSFGHRLIAERLAPEVRRLDAARAR